MLTEMCRQAFNIVLDKHEKLISNYLHMIAMLWTSFIMLKPKCLNMIFGYHWMEATNPLNLHEFNSISIENMHFNVTNWLLIIRNHSFHLWKLDLFDKKLEIYAGYKQFAEMQRKQKRTELNPKTKKKKQNNSIR